MAYEWNNYRLTTDKINNIKSNNIGIIDPFEVKTGWFVLDFPSCYIRPLETLDKNNNEKVQNTINIFKLNSCERANKRYDIIYDYIKSNISFDFLKKNYPYIACEIERQGLREDLDSCFGLR